MLYNSVGNRKYLTERERRRFIECAWKLPPHVGTFCLTLAYTGARLSEVMALRAGSIDRTSGIVIIESLKKRRKGVFRHVPVPEELLAHLDTVHALGDVSADKLIWAWGRTTAWKHVKAVMLDIGAPISCASPKALRHAFGVVGISEAKVPLNMMQKWLGHSRIETTAIYANAVGSEERKIARRMWHPRHSRE